VRSAFQEQLKVELTLTTGGKSFSIPGGQVKDLSVKLANHGFTASVTFWSLLEKQDAPLFKAFSKPDLLQVKLAVSSVDPTLQTPPAPVVVQGLARARRIIARTHGGLKGDARVFRRYTLEFADPAQVLWRQHRPIELHTDTSMADIIDAHKASLQVSHDWPVLRQKQAMLCLAIGADAPEVSFYDFVLSYVNANNGVFTYDSQKNQYLLADAKSSQGTVAPLSRLRVGNVEVRLPPPIRHGARVLNAIAQGPTTAPLTHPQAATGMAHDVLLRTPLTTQAEQRQKLEKSRLQVRQRQLRISFKQFPSVDVFPGALLKLAGPLWPEGQTGLGEDLRVVELELRAHAELEGQHDEQQQPVASYDTVLSVQLESASDPVATLPPHRAPSYPIQVEGLVHSPGGEEKDRRYLIVDDEKTSVSSFQMDVPLWGKTVSVPANPIHFPGHFFFPPYKKTPVLLALHFDRAEFLRFVNWKEGVRTPQDGQGDQILLGLNKESQTALTHDFQDDKPVWRMHRVSKGDTQIIRMGEGYFFMQVKETPSGGPPMPTYDVSPQVEAAKSDLSAAVGAAIGEASASYKAAMGAVRAKMKSAQAEAKAAFSGARSEVGAKVTEAKTGLQGAAGRLAQGANKLAGSAAQAKAALEKLRR
jgi:hypothetical protein